MSSGPLPFITVDDNDKFTINEQAVEYLKGLEGKIAVISIAGMYRTGKSLLLNLLMGKNDNSTSGFEVGPTVKACTKGLWLWGKAIQVEGSDLNLLFIDTEGLGSTIRSETYDSRIFALTILLSSYFLYNSFGTIDGNAISKLSLIVNLTKHIHVRALPSGKEDSGTEFAQFFPQLMWVVRDFAVKLERDGKRISSREYLEDALRPEEVLNESSEQKNAVRLLLRNFFPERDCVTLVRPVADEKQLTQLGTLSRDSLRPEFANAVEALRKRIISSARPKTLYGKPLNGAMLAHLAEAYIVALNNNAAPTISSAWTRVVEQQSIDASRSALELYESTMESKLSELAYEAAQSSVQAADQMGLRITSEDIPSLRNREMSPKNTAVARENRLFPVSDTALLQAHREAESAAAALFMRKAVQDARSSHFEQKLREDISERFSSYWKLNGVVSERVAKRFLQILQPLVDADIHALDQASPSSSVSPSTFSVLSSETASSQSTTHSRPVSGSKLDRSELTEALVRLQQAQVPASRPFQQLRASLESLSDRFNTISHSLGSSKQLALLAHITGPAISSSIARAHAAERTAAELEQAHAAVQEDLTRALTAARAREETARQLLAEEKRSKEAALAEAARLAASDAQLLRAQLSAREAELQRSSDKFDRAATTFQAAQTTFSSTISALQDDLSAARARTEEILRERLTVVGTAESLQRSIAEKSAELVKKLELVAELEVALEKEKSKRALAEERAAAAQKALDRTEEEMDLLRENNINLKGHISVKIAEKEEAEFQWGVTKARIAELEGEKMGLESELEHMEALVRTIKEALVKDKGVLKKVDWGRGQLALFENIQ